MTLIIKNKKNLNNFSDRLKLAIGEHTYRAFADVSGVAATTLRDYVTGRSFPTLDRLTAIADASGQSLEWLATGEIPDNRMISVYQYDLMVSAGDGSYIDHENPVAKFEFSEDWLRSQSLFNKVLSIVPVNGDSMEPTLYDGDLIIVRHNEFDDGICVIRINGRLMVKRIQHDFIDGSYEISSDNPHYKSRTITKDFDGDFSVVGQVVRVLQRVRQNDTVQ